MRYALFTSLLLVGALAAAPRLSAQGGEVPSGIQGQRAAQVATQVLGLRTDLMLTDKQVKQLSALRTSFQGERSRFGRGPRARHGVRRPVTSSSVAYRKAAAILSPAQRSAAFQLLDRAPARNTASLPSDPLAGHAAGAAAPAATQDTREHLDPLLHGAGQAPAEQPEAGRKASTSPITHRE